MNSQQLELMLAYISNEIALNALRSVGMSWESQNTNRHSLVAALRGTVTPELITQPEPEPKFKLTPLKVEMLTGLRYMPKFTQKFPSLHFPAQQAAIEEFNYYGLINVVRADLEPYSLTEKGRKLVDKILKVTL